MISSIFRSILFGLHKKETPVLEHDIKIIADEGYNGIIAINESHVTCNYDSVNDFWYWDKPSNLTITSISNFCCGNTTNQTLYNEQSKYIKEIYFSENVCTSTCTSLKQFFDFYGATCNIEYADVSKFDTSNVTSMYASFGDGCKIDNIHGYENWNTANVTEFNYCFNSTNFTNNIDLHNWVVNSSAIVNMMFISERTISNFSVFYTPSKWDSNKRAFATIRHDLCIYPYHKINVAANSGFNGKIWNNSTSSFDDLTYDSSLDYWYSDSNLTDLKCALTYGSGSWQNTTALNITSASFKDLTITGNQGVREIFNKDTNLRSVAFVNCDLKSVNDGAFCVAETNCTSITGINELGKNSTAFLYAYFYNRDTSIITSFVPEITTNRFDSSYLGCSALVNLTFADGFILQNGANTTNAFNGCTALTTIKGNNFTLLETLDLSACPLTLDSAKVILRALGTVTSETLTFKSTTVSLIEADAEGRSLCLEAKAKGWNVNAYGNIFSGTSYNASTAFNIYINDSAVKITPSSSNWSYKTNTPITTLNHFCNARNSGDAHYSGKVLKTLVIKADLSRVTNYNRFVMTQSYLTSVNMSECKMYSGSSTVNVVGIFNSCTVLASLSFPITQWNVSASEAFTSNSLTSLPYIDWYSNGNSVYHWAHNMTKLTTINKFIGISSTSTNSTTWGTNSALKYINASNPILNSVTFNSALTLASAKIILNALGTVSGKTCTFSSTTKGYINADTAAKNLVTQARNRGWTIPLT